MDKIRKEMKDMATSEEDVISYALFTQVAKRFFENRSKGGQMEPGQTPVRKESLSSREKTTTQAKVKTEETSAKEPVENNGGGVQISREVNDMNLQDIKELIKLINETAVNEVKLESEGMKISIKKGADREVNPVNQAPVLPEQAAGQVKENAAPTPAVKTEEKKLGLIPVVSPMVGTFYAAPAPDAPPYVKVGDQVKKGQTLCIIEAMKLMNKIDSEVDGEIVEIAVENGDSVEYGQTIFLIKEKK
jgi:oxaloacetate decarboxylase alpha subunit